MAGFTAEESCPAGADRFDFVGGPAGMCALLDRVKAGCFAV